MHASERHVAFSDDYFPDDYYRLTSDLASKPRQENPRSLIPGTDGSYYRLTNDFAGKSRQDNSPNLAPKEINEGYYRLASDFASKSRQENARSFVPEINEDYYRLTSEFPDEPPQENSRSLTAPEINEDYYRLASEFAEFSPRENPRSPPPRPTSEFAGKSQRENAQSLTLESNEDYLEETPRKRVRIRVPVVRKNGRQHKVTVVRRRPVASKSEDSTPSQLTVASHTPRRIVVTRVRSLGLVNTVHADSKAGDSARPDVGRHKVTITRRRKIGSTTVLPTSSDRRGRITRKKLIAVRPVQPTPSFAIITTGFFTAPSSEYDDEYSEEDEEEKNKKDVGSTVTPALKEPPNVIDSKPDEVEIGNKEDIGSTVTPELKEPPNVIDNKSDELNARVTESKMTVEESSVSSPVIITDNFFFPASSDDEYEEYEEYTDTTTESVRKDISTTTEESVSSTSETSDLSGKEGPTSENDHETTESIDSKEEEILTTEKSVGEGREVTTAQTSLEENSEEDGTTVQSEIEKDEEEDEERERTTTETIEITTLTGEITTMISVSDEGKTTTASDKMEEEYSSTEHPASSDESESESEESYEKDIESRVTTVTPEEISQKDTEDSLENNVKSNVTRIEADSKESSVKDSEDSLERDIEAQVTRTKSEDSPRIDNEDTPEVSTESQDSQMKDANEEPNKDDSQSPDSHPSVALSPSSKPETDRSFPDPIDVTTLEHSPETTSKLKEIEKELTVEPIKPATESILSSATTIFFDELPTFASVLPLETSQSTSYQSSTLSYLDDSEVPSVIPLGAEYTSLSDSTRTATVLEATSISSPTPEEIEAGLADDLYLSLSRPDFPEILPSRPVHAEHEARSETPDLEPSTSVYYTETVVTSTRLRTYTYVVTQLNGLETKVTSSTTVRPRVTTLTLTVPVTVTVTPTVESSAHAVTSVYSPVPAAGE